MHLIFKIQNDSTKFSFETLWRKIIKEKIQEPWIKKCTTTYQALRWFFLVASTLSVSQEPNEEWYYCHRDNIKEKVTKNWHFFFGWFLVLLMLDLRSLFFLEGLSFCIFNSTLGIWSINDKLEDELLGIFYFRVETWVYDSFVLLLVSIPIDGAVVKFIFSPWYPTQISFVVYVLKY